MAGTKKTYFSLTEVAELLHTSKESVRRLIDRGEIAAIDISPSGGKRQMIRISERSVEDFIASRATGKKPQRRPRRQRRSVKPLKPVKKFI